MSDIPAYKNNGLFVENSEQKVAFTKPAYDLLKAQKRLWGRSKPMFSSHEYDYGWFHVESMAFLGRRYAAGVHKRNPKPVGYKGIVKLRKHLKKMLKGRESRRIRMRNTMKARFIPVYMRWSIQRQFNAMTPEQLRMWKGGATEH